MIPLLAYLAVGWAAKAYFQRRILAGNPFFGAPITVTLCVVVAPTVMYLEGFRYPGEDAAQAMIALYGALINNVLIAMFFILGGVFLTTDWRRYAGLAAILTIAYMSHFIQFRDPDCRGARHGLRRAGPIGRDRRHHGDRDRLCGWPPICARDDAVEPGIWKSGSRS